MELFILFFLFLVGMPLAVVWVQRRCDRKIAELQRARQRLQDEIETLKYRLMLEQQGRAELAATDPKI